MRPSPPPAPPSSLALLALLAGLTAAGGARADAFDRYINPVLDKAAGSKNVKEVRRLTADLILDHDAVIPGASAAFVVVKTNDGRYSKLLVRPARQKVDDRRSVSILLVERFVTYKEGEERAVVASGGKLALYPGFRLSLDLGQVVPEEVGGDVRFVNDGGKESLQPLGKAKMYLLTRPMPEAAPKKGGKLVVGRTFEPRYFNGTYHLHDDGRRSGRLTLKVDEDGEVSGAYYSDKDGKKYEVHGKLGTPQYSIHFTVKFPRSEQTFHGWLFTGDAKAMAGTSRLADREAGFYAVRVED